MVVVLARFGTAVWCSVTRLLWLSSRGLVELNWAIMFIHDYVKSHDMATCVFDLYYFFVIIDIFLINIWTLNMSLAMATAHLLTNARVLELFTLMLNSILISISKCCMLNDVEWARVGFTSGLMKAHFNDVQVTSHYRGVRNTEFPNWLITRKKVFSSYFYVNWPVVKL